jgi:septum formation protein
MTVVLASASPVRAELLRRAGVEIAVDPARVDEVAVKASLLAEGAPPRDVADKLAEMKAVRVARRHDTALVIGADQVLVHGGEILDKPASMEEARAHLIRLRGQQHELLSAAVIVAQGAPVWRQIGKARLTMRPFSDAFLDRYLDQAGERALTSVGAYQLEDLGAQLFARVDGDYFTVLGLPLLEILGFLRARGILVE